ncbi:MULTISPECIES: hypothetical protein [Pseudoalteromonas]|uniref:Uncharacterized protein n=1 Tax=Pseudoalteromonas amylolytica TaxID=1859457 RepID=A0A1S1MWV7_9GAMM|nr:MULTISPECIES: hypothetical protein [Pseudoalteromonas]OHU92284.1 hypothetical protein BFC16_00005 [Pseudoalteromonas sp. JW3]OHU93264.1 hypothetical protein BET10_00005 [Pseudoalteromonas amylolytica]
MNSVSEKIMDSQRPLISLNAYNECFRSALRRLAIFFNSGKQYTCSHRWLELSDEGIRDEFKAKRLDPLLISFRKLQAATEKLNQAPDSERAEHEFYGRFQFQQRSAPSRRHVTFDCTEVFYDWSLLSLHMPRVTTGCELTSNSEKLLSQAATNYLVKNFWHNVVHKLFQGIHELNFHEFGGGARYESDFTADNLANIMLLVSYGITPSAKGGVLSKAKVDNITKTFELNRCNRVFAERARVRNENNSELEEFQESIWRFKRQLANRVSILSLSKGASVTDLAIYLTGKIQDRKDKRGGYFHSGRVIVRMNGVYINSDLPPYLEVTSNGYSVERNNDIANFRNERIEEISRVCCIAYTSKLRNDPSLRKYAQDSLESTIERLRNI